MFTKNDQLAVNAIRCLSLAQIEKANSGHPGLPMGASPMAYVLFNKILKANPKMKIGLIEIGLFCQQAMALQCFIHFCTCQDMIYQLKI